MALGSLKHEIPKVVHLDKSSTAHCEFSGEKLPIEQSAAG